MTELSEKHLEALKKMKKFEDERPESDYYLGFEWWQVGVAQATINVLITMDLVKRTFASRSTKAHELTDKAKAILAGEEENFASVATPAETLAPEFVVDPTEMFQDIVGYDDIKELLRESLQLEKTLHTLLVGPPSIAKTMFLWDIERAGGGQAMWLIGSATSRAGLWEAVVNSRPRWLLIDELDKMGVIDQTALLSLLEKGRLVRTKIGKKFDVTLDVWVVASANRINKLSPELLSRFAICRLEEYGPVEFRNVVTSALVTHEGIDRDTAGAIATRLVGKTHDVRDAVRVARLSARVGVARAVELLIK